MEMRVTPYTLPENVSFNFDELKEQVAEVAARYAARIYSDDQIKTAKADKAELNRLRKAINDERLRREKEFMKPFAEFKERVGKILSLIDGAVAPIDAQVKDYDRRKKEEKRQEIEKLFASYNFARWLTVDMIFDEKWLNATTPMKKVAADIELKLHQIDGELSTLEALPEFSFEAVEAYKQTLDIAKAIAEGKHLADIQRRKEEAAREAAGITPAAEQPTVPEMPATSAQKPDESVVPVAEAVSFVKFAAYMTVPQALELRQWFKARGIQFSAIV